MTAYGEPERLLILAKTYPQPSTKYRETSCVVAMTEQGELRRLYPVPFRLLEGEQRFAKWQWITARVSPPNDDRRPESRRIDVDSVERVGASVGTRNGWAERINLITHTVVDSRAELDCRHAESGQSLGVLHVSRLLGLEIERSGSTEWTEKEIERLTRQGLFDNTQARSRPLLEKIPYTFRYHYEIDTANGAEQSRHPITDWEVCQFYRRCVNDYRNNWESKFCAKIEEEFGGCDLYLLVGNMHRLPDQWLIVSVIYPPRKANSAEQLSLPL